MSDNNKFIYQEVTEARRGQQLDIEHLNNKAYWILSTSSVVVGLLINADLSYHFGYLIGCLLILTSFFYSLKALLSKKYRHGPALSELHKMRKESKLEVLIASTNKKIISDIKSNKDILWELQHNLKISIIYLFIGMVVTALTFFGFWTLLCILVS
jgi:hypothetical protein